MINSVEMRATRSTRQTVRLAGVSFALLIGVLYSLPSYAAFKQSLHFSWLSMQDGLPSPFVQSIVQDQQGYIWIGTQDGLNRYDGREIKTFQKDPNNSNSLSNNSILALHANEQGVWIGTPLGLELLSPGAYDFRQIGLSENSLATQINAITEDEDGTVWLGTDQGLVAIRKSGAIDHYTQSTFERNRDTPLNVISLSANNQSLWIGSAEHGLYRLDRATSQLAPVALGSGTDATPAITALSHDNRGRLWIGTNGAGLWQRDPTGALTQHLEGDPTHGHLASNRIAALKADHQANLWIGYKYDGLTKLELSSGHFSHYPPSAERGSSVSSGTINDLYQDRSGVVWAATQRGVSSWNAQLSQMYLSAGLPDKAEIPAGNVSSFANAGRGRLWVGYRDRGLELVDLKTATQHRYGRDEPVPYRLPSDRVTAVAATNSGKLWAALKGEGIVRIDPAKGLEPLPILNHPAPLKRVRQLTIDGERLWIATDNGVFHLVSPSGEIKHIYHQPGEPNSLSSNDISQVYIDKGHTLWVATRDGGLNQSHASGFHHLRHNRDDPFSLSSDNTSAVHEDAAGNLWIGTADAGLNLWLSDDRQQQNPRFKRFTRRDGLPSNVVYGISSDKQGNVWITSGAGLVKVTNRGAAMSTFTQLHGLQNERFNAGANLMLTNGMIAVGGAAGFDVFDPAQMHINRYPPAVVLAEVLVYNQPVEWRPTHTAGERLSFANDDSMVTFRYAALEFSAPASNLIQHRVLGFDDTWVNNNKSGEATYTHLPPGDYAFQVRASNHDGVTSEQPLTVPFRVEAPWWTTQLALACYTILLSILGFFIVRETQRRMQVAEQLNDKNQALHQEIKQRQKEQEAVRKLEQRVHNNQKMEALGTLSRGIAHDFNNILGAIQGYTELTRLDIEQSEQAAGHLNQLEGSVQRARQLVQSILTFSKQAPQAPQPCDINEVIEGVLQLVRPSLPSNVGLRVDTNSGIPPILGDPVQLNQLLMNLCTNAYQAMGESGGELAIRVEQQDIVVPEPGDIAPLRETQHVVIQVADTGVGMDEETLTRAFEPFFTTKDRTSGTGLGLSVVHGIVNQIGGTINVVSQPGEGTTFTVTMPCANVNAVISELDVMTQDIVGGQETLLLVDDELSLVEICAAVLERLGYTVVSATNGVAALELYESGEYDFDLVLADQMMPQKLGSELAAELQKRNPQLPIILMSGGDTTHANDPAIAYFMRKPFTRSELAQAVRHTLDQYLPAKSAVGYRHASEVATVLTPGR